MKLFRTISMIAPFLIAKFLTALPVQAQHSDSWIGIVPIEDRIPDIAELSPPLLVDGGYYALVSRHSGKCLDVTDWSRTPGQSYQQWDCNWGQSNQTFRLSGSIDGGWALFSNFNGMCVTASSRNNGAAVVQSDQCYGIGMRINMRHSSDATFRLEFANSGRCADVSGWATWNGARIIQWDCHGGANQEWYLIQL